MEKKKKRQSYLVEIFITLAFVLVIGIWVYFNFLMNLNTPDSYETMGQIGDSFGKITSLFTGLALAGAIGAILLQRKDIQLHIEANNDYKEGIKDIDARILEISKHVNILQVEALGNNADEIVAEAQRLINLGLSKNSTVFKIPISLEGTKACRKLTQKGFQVNLHLVYTIQQAYMAFSANATYICPLVGRLQDQGHDALGLLKECVDISKRYNYKSKIMFSSVRHIEHVKNALQIGVHACTIPWGVMKKLTENHFTTIGTTQFVEDTMLLTTKVKDVMISENVQLHKSKKILDALLIMTKSKLGALAIMDDDNSLYRVFTDGDLRRLLYKHGDKISNMYLSELEPHIPIFIDPEASLFDAKNLCRTKSVDNLAVIKRNKFYGLIDIQHLI